MAAAPFGCGTSKSDNPSDEEVAPQFVGGVLPPEKLKYAVNESSELHLSGVSPQDLPRFVDLRRDDIIPPVQNQRWNSCVGWSLGYYLLTALEAQHQRNRGGWLDMRNPENWFSPDYIYSHRDSLPEREEALARRAAVGDPFDEPICFEGDGEIGCMRPERALSLLTAKGCCRWSWMCGNEAGGEFRPCGVVPASGQAGSRLPVDLATAGADRHRARCYVRFGALGDLSLRTEFLMQQWLHEQGTPIAIVVRMTEGWVRYRGENRRSVVVGGTESEPITEERGVCLDAGGRELQAQHMMTVIGYDRSFPNAELFPGLPDEQCGSFLVINQWGTKWGDQGLMWITCSELSKIWVAGYGLIRAEYGAASSPSAICAQDESGLIITPLEDNDVPTNLECPTEDTEGNCLVSYRLAAEPTATPLISPLDPQLPPGPLLPETEVSRSDTVGDQDPADWFYFDVPIDHMPVTIRLGIDEKVWTVATRPQVGVSTETTSAVPAHRILDWKLTDNTYQKLGRFDPVTGEIAAELCAGRYFLKVQPNRGELYDALVPGDPSVAYQFTVRAGAPLETPLDPGSGCANAPATSDGAERLLRSTTIADQRVGPSDELYRLYRVTVSAGTELRVRVAGVPAGSRVQLVTGHFGAYPQHKHWHGAQSRVADAQGAEIRVRPPSDAHWTMSDREQSWAHAFISVRYLDGADVVPYTLHTSVYRTAEFAPPTPSEELITIDGDTDLPGLPSGGTMGDTLDGRWRTGPTDRFLLLPDWECCRVDRLVLEISDVKGNARVEITDGSGAPVPEVTVEDVYSRPGKVFKRIRVEPAKHPSLFRKNLWVALVDQGGAPLRNFSMRRTREWSLADWPNVEHARFRPDADDRPSSGQDLSLDSAAGPRTEGIGIEPTPTPPGTWSALTGLPEWDYWDFYRVRNTHDGPARIEVSIGNVSYPSAAIVLSVWQRSLVPNGSGTGVRRVYDRQILINRGWLDLQGLSADPPLQITVDALPEETVYVMIECFSGLTEYTIEARTK
jgi:hypothetical protein